MSKQQFTRTFGSLADFAEQFGEAYVAAAIPPGQAAERIHAAPAKVTVVTNEDRAKQERDYVAGVLRKARGGKKRVKRAVSKSKSRRVTKVM